MTNPIAIIGAGPYGLSIGAYLRSRGVPFRIFGKPMESWQQHMPEGMRLKSEGFASNLYAPSADSTLKHFCEKTGVPYRDRGLPVPLETLVAYGLHFQRQFVPQLEPQRVASVDKCAAGFAVRLEDGETFTAKSVVAAVGVGHFRHVPSPLRELPAGFASHSYSHRCLAPFRGRDVAVVGGGASALDLAGLLAGAGASVRLITRRPPRWGTPPELDRSLWKRLRYPESRLGLGLKLRLSERAGFFYYLPTRTRQRIVGTWLGPAGGWFMKDVVEGRVPQIVGYSLSGASIEGGRVKLTLADEQQQPLELETDHVIAATGYKVDLGRLTFLSDALKAQIRMLGQIPLLSNTFQSSVAGLHFVGLASATQFGPSMRFMAGAEYTARTLAATFA